jgi:large subunit ribosomal protein L7/L12
MAWWTNTPARKYTEPGEFRVVLQLTGPKVVTVIREIRVTTGIGLVEAKNMADAPPVVVVEKVSEQSAGLIVDLLRRAGARAVATPIEQR